MLLVIIMFVPDISNAETYQCAYLFEDQPRSTTHKRISKNIFSVRSANGTSEMDVLFEDDAYLTLGAMRSYSITNGYNVVIIKKDGLIFRSTAILDPINISDTVAIIEGNCLLD